MAPSRSDQGPWYRKQGRTKENYSTSLKSLSLIDLPEGMNGWRWDLGKWAVSFKEQRARDWGAPEILPMKRGEGEGGCGDFSFLSDETELV